ncbi:MAG: acyl-CoA thioesterase, partial [Burkholderiales bacterium]|nr:acyl-CoA thioesterase [Burkholderiales bacterium]
PRGEQPVLRIIPMPADTNAHGTIFGGWVMAQVDLAGSVPAYERAQGNVVTVAVNSFSFKEPVFVGDLVSFYARVVKVGRTSITVDVEVFAQRGRDGRLDAVKVTEAQLTYVAIDADRKPRPIPGGPQWA